MHEQLKQLFAVLKHWLCERCTAMSRPVYIVGDSTTAFAHDSLMLDDGKHQKRDEPLTSFCNPAIWREAGFILLSVSGSDVKGFIEQVVISKSNPVDIYIYIYTYIYIYMYRCICMYIYICIYIYIYIHIRKRAVINKKQINEKFNSSLHAYV